MERIEEGVEGNRKKLRIQQIWVTVDYKILKMLIIFSAILGQIENSF